MIDLHCHILPQVDDGAGSPEESISMAGIAVKDGIHSIVATPHSLNGIYMNPIKEVTAKVATLKKALGRHNIELGLFVGGDVHLCPRMMDLIESGDAVTINNAKKFILLELPSQMIPRGVEDEIFAMRLNGVTPIITHPERNIAIQHDPDVLYKLVCMGALGQVTAMSLTGGFGDAVQQAAESLLAHRLVHMIATDAHSSKSRAPILSHAVETAGGIIGDNEEAKGMVTAVPEAILSGKAPDVPEPSRIKVKGRSFEGGF